MLRKPRPLKHSISSCSEFHDTLSAFGSCNDATKNAAHRVPELILVLGSQPADDVSHKPGGRLPLLSARPEVTLATLKGAATNFAAW